MASPAVPSSEGSLLTAVADFFSVHHIGNLNDKYIQNFQFIPDVTPLSSPYGVAGVVLCYFATIKALQYLVRVRGKPFDLKWFVVLHNSLMSIGSAVLWLAMVTELVRIVSADGWWSLICDPAGRHTQGPIYFIYFVNYVFKYIELMDTFLLALRGKPIPFLHSYHHAATLALCWSQLWAQSCIQWLPIVINLFVHIVMYAYYTLGALRIHVWWKRYLTLLQIVQFVVALSGCIGAFATRVLALKFNVLEPTTYACYGSDNGAWFGIAIIASYLYLFIVLYNAKYEKKPRGAKKEYAAAAGLNGHANGNGSVKPSFEETSNGYTSSAAHFDLHKQE